MAIYPALEDVLEIHQRFIAQFGGSLGVHDMGALESALFRPQSGYSSFAPEAVSACRNILQGATLTSLDKAAHVEPVEPR